MLIPVTKIRIPLLMGDGGQDTIWDSAGSVSATFGSKTAELARTDVGWALLAALRTVAGRGDMGAWAVDRFMDLRARQSQRIECCQCDNPCHLCRQRARCMGSYFS
jgi:hypothetical protein